MGIPDAPVDLINLPLDQVPGVEFYPDAAGNFGDNIEYDKNKFLAYRNALQLSKMLLLQETDPLADTNPPGVTLEQLSKLMNDALAAAGEPATYDWSLLNVWGDHGASILTTTLPKPAERTTIVSVDAANDVITVPLGHKLRPAIRSATASAAPTSGSAPTPPTTSGCSATRRSSCSRRSPTRTRRSRRTRGSTSAPATASCSSGSSPTSRSWTSRTASASRPASSTSSPTSGRG